MSVAVCRSSASGFESILMLNTRNSHQESNTNWLTTTTPLPPTPSHLFEIENNKDDDVVVDNKQPGQSDIWASIQSQKAQQADDQADKKPYVHPLMRTSSSLLSQKSLEICTESLGSETGSDDYFSSDDEITNYLFSSSSSSSSTQQKSTELPKRNTATVNYHCSAGRRGSNPRPFPPPLPSISRRDGPCLQMRPHRRDGRLVVEAVSVPSQNFLHAERRNGRLLLSFINPTAAAAAAAAANHENNNSEEEEEEEQVVEEEEEEVEVVDRGTVVEVKVSTQPQQQSGGPAAMKVHRSSIVINKFVSCNLQLNDQIQLLSNDVNRFDNAFPAAKRLPSTATTTAAAAAVAASSASVLSDEEEEAATATRDSKLLFTSKRRNREELLHDVRRCSQLRKPLFIWEPCCIATST